jgi:DNA (cytosine-5)-methyltransferase 1
MALTMKSAIFSFFSGAGFLDLGFEQSGFQTVFANEYHRPFLNAYKYSREKLGIPKPMFGYFQDDISVLQESNEAEALQNRVNSARRSFDVVGFIGGPPCPDFSVAGKNRGKDGKNGILSQVYVDIIVRQKPDFFLFENVKGLWRTKTHRAFFEKLKSELSEAGYLLTERLINSIEFGAPQDRDRIILLGFLKTAIGKNIPAELSEIFPWTKFAKFNRNTLTSDIWPQSEIYTEGKDRRKPENIIEELTVQHWFKKNQVELHPNSKDCFTPRAALPRFKTIDEGDDSRKCFKRLHRWRFSPTAAYGNNEVHLHPYHSRRISVAEALAIQSLPKEFLMPPDMTLTDKFKAVGNGVPYLAAQSMAKSIYDFMSFAR